jgi:hypothetical protein
VFPGVEDGQGYLDVELGWYAHGDGLDRWKIEHDAIVEAAILDVEPFCHPVEALGVGVGDGDDLDIAQVVQRREMPLLRNPAAPDHPQS